MYTIPATPVHCFARSCAHRDPVRCLMRVPPFYITKSKPKPKQSSSSPSPSTVRTARAPPPPDASHSSSSELDCTHSATRRAADRLAKSRATGQSYRDNERQHIFRLITAVENGRLENTLLFVLFSYAYKRQAVDMYSRAPRCHLSQLPSDTSEDCAPYMSSFMYPLSRDSQLLLGQRMMSGTMATVLLELLMHRRNMWGTTHAMQLHDHALACEREHELEPRCDTDRRRRRRPPYRTATTARDADSVVSFAVRQFSRERVQSGADQTNHICMRDHVQRRLGHLAMAAYHVDHCEALRNATYSLFVLEHPQRVTADGAPAEQKAPLPETPSSPERPSSPTTPDAAEFGSWLRLKRADGAKRCSRCGVLKITGSGHARSKCADGLSISSRVPFAPCAPPPPPPVAADV